MNLRNGDRGNSTLWPLLNPHSYFRMVHCYHSKQHAKVTEQFTNKANFFDSRAAPHPVVLFLSVMINTRTRSVRPSWLGSLHTNTWFDSAALKDSARSEPKPAKHWGMALRYTHVKLLSAVVFLLSHLLDVTLQRPSSQSLTRVDDCENQTRNRFKSWYWVGLFGWLVS